MNISDPNTQPELTVANSLIYSVPVSVVIGTILSIFTLMTIVFNLGGALIFLMDKSLHTFADCLIVNLMLADGSVGLLVMPVKVILALTSNVWVWNRESCLVFITVEATTNLVSVVNTLIVTLDHYWLVRKRQKYTAQRTLNRLLIMCISPWIIVLVFYGSPHFLWEFKVSEDSKPGSCNPPFQNDLGINLTLVLSPFAPVIAVPILDTLIYYSLRRQLFHRLRCLLQSGKVGVKYLSSVGLIPGTDTKSLARIYNDSWTCSCEETEDTKQSQNAMPLDALHLDDNSISEASTGSMDVDIDFTAQPPTIDPHTTHVTNSSCNSDEPSASSLDNVDGNSLAEELSKAEEQEVEETGSAPPEALGKKVEGRLQALKEFALDMKESRLSLTLGTVLVFTCAPFESLNLVGTICGIVQSCVFTLPSKLLQGCRWWLVLSSTVNPVLIFSLDHRYRDGFFSFFRQLRGQSLSVEKIDATSAVSPL